jgi:aspartate carbamoyltransferase catalytic subunit
MKAHRRLKIKGEKEPIPIISGGSGKKQHPTQSLLDIYTLERSFKNCGGLDGKTIMLVGDLKRGRTVRSLSFLMKEYQNIKMIFCAPKEYQMEQDILDFLDKHQISYKLSQSISEYIEEADAVYMTRIQDEWGKKQTNGEHEVTRKEFIFTMENLKNMKPNACLLHPLPKRDEIDTEIDYCNDKRVVYWRQERNGMWMRVALIASLFKVDQDILDYNKNSLL